MASHKTHSSQAFPASGRGSAKTSAMTSETIASDLKRFEKAGGKIEKLGNTPALKHIKPEE